MPAQCTERWSDYTAARRPEEWTISKSWTVIDAETEDEAFAATPMSGSIAIPEEGKVLSVDSPYVCKNRIARPDGGPTTWIVTCQLSSIEDESGTGSLDALLQPAMITTGYRKISIQRDVNVKGVAITNANKQPFNTAATVDVDVIDFIIERNEPFYDMNSYAAFADRVNGTATNIGNIAVPARACLASLPQLVGEYKFQAPYVNKFVRVRYVFSLCVSPLVPNPWDFVAANIGDEGYYYDDEADDGSLKIDRFQSATGKILSNVRLKADGTPIDPSITVMGNTPYASGWTPGSGVLAETKGDLVQLTYYMRETYDFSTLVF